MARPGPSKVGEEPVARGVDLASTEARQLLADDGVVLVEQRAPTGVTELGGPRGGADDVGEEDGREHPVRVCARFALR